jgi:hypothetical protein
MARPTTGVADGNVTLYVPAKGVAVAVAPALVSVAFDAVTVNVYDVPADRPVTVQVVAGGVAAQVGVDPSTWGDAVTV